MMIMMLLPACHTTTIVMHVKMHVMLTHVFHSRAVTLEDFVTN